MQRKLLVFLVLFASFSLVYSSIAYYSFSKPPTQPFIGFGVFSSTGTLSNYFSGTEANVTVGKILSWHFAVNNQMGSVQWVRVVYRLANSTSLAPNASAPANDALILGNNSIFVSNFQTALLNFTWSVDSKTKQGGSVYINMTINGQKLSPAASAVGGLNFRFFFELWTFDIPSDSFQYGYKGQTSRVGVPLALWFNVV